MSKYYLGIDTSAYTTSIGVIDGDNNIILDLRKTLQVGDNKKGLRQQEALFQHVNNIPLLIEELSNSIDINMIDTISVSTSPRNTKDSYMPVFLVGKHQGFILSQILRKPYKEFSHQEGHIGACLMNQEGIIKQDEKYLSLHISGGTSEIIQVKDSIDNLDISLLGGSLDISIGKLIDRIGVALGLDFPCGNAMDELSQKGKRINKTVPISIKDYTWTNLSGLENYFMDLILTNNYPKEDIAVTLFHTISIILQKLIGNTLKDTDVNNILISGGVSANLYIRKFLKNSLGRDINIIFPERGLSTDNGVGLAYLGKIKKGHREV